mmetsp:Transcript_11599/g.43569  ORF Transcript_11599/g.43569 Transcript_11599/m.43569 type:complete len:258 (-) Transcript_11599:1779-2552(-)
MVQMMMWIRFWKRSKWVVRHMEDHRFVRSRVRHDPTPMWVLPQIEEVLILWLHRQDLDRALEPPLSHQIQGRVLSRDFQTATLRRTLLLVMMYPSIPHSIPRPPLWLEKTILQGRHSLQRWAERTQLVIHQPLGNLLSLQTEQTNLLLTHNNYNPLVHLLPQTTAHNSLLHTMTKPSHTWISKLDSSQKCFAHSLRSSNRQTKDLRTNVSSSCSQRSKTCLLRFKNSTSLWMKNARKRCASSQSGEISKGLCVRRLR